MSGVPLRYVHQNVLFGRSGERMALYRVEPVSYLYRPDREKRAWLVRGAHLAFGLGVDFSIWRVARAWPVERYVDQAAALYDSRAGDGADFRRYLEGHAEALAERRAHVPEVYLGVSLRPPEPRGLRGALARSERLRRRVEELVGVGGSDPIARADLEATAHAEEQAYERVAASLPARRARSAEIQWLLRRPACRGIAEPLLDPQWEPNALVVEAEGGQLAYEPCEADILRLLNPPLHEQERALRIDCEEGSSYQAMLALGTFPATSFPGAEAELLCAPLERCGFPVDAVLHARWLGNREAIGQVRKRIVDADNVYAEELATDAGPLSFQAEANRELARELDAYLRTEPRPLLFCSASLALGSDSPRETDRRCQALADIYEPAPTVYRPLGLQERLFFDHLPRADGGVVRDYEQVLTIEQLGATMPWGTHAAGSQRGVLIGDAVADGRALRPVLFDPTEAPRSSRAPSILLAGTLGSGKTLTAELLAYQAARRGSLVVAIDPKGDAALDRAPGLEGQVQVIELTGDERYRGLLDPLAHAPQSIREELAGSYLMELLPEKRSGWETEIRRAVRDAIDGGGRTLVEVLERLKRAESPEARSVADSLEVWADSGLGRLAFGAGAPGEVRADYPVTILRTQALALPPPNAARSEYDQAERLGVATLKLVAAYAMQLALSDRSRHAAIVADEAWVFVASRDGKRLLDKLNRLGRSENATLMLATQQLGDVEDIEHLIGTRLIFGQETVAEAKRGLELLGLDPEDSALVERVRGFATNRLSGRCLMRDIDDQIAEVQIDHVYEDLLLALRTDPGAHETPDREAEATA